MGGGHMEFEGANPHVTNMYTVAFVPFSSLRHVEYYAHQHVLCTPVSWNINI